MKRLPASVALIALFSLSPLVSPAAPAPAGSCDARGAPFTSVIMDGDLWVMIRSQRGRYLFGWSGNPPVSSVEEAVRLTRMLGIRGSDLEITRFLLNAPGIVGGDHMDGGAIGYFDLKCPSSYRATAVVRRTPYPATRIWLHQQRRDRVLRSFCMRPQLLPVGSRISVIFRVPLRAGAPRYEIDRDADGVFERSGTFLRGGASFPSTDARC